MSSIPENKQTISGNNPNPIDLPLHVAIIMDGNGRWALKKGLPRIAGHRAGVDKIRMILNVLGEAGVKFVTIYAFSTENWSRPKSEVSGIMGILEDVIETETERLHQSGVRIIHLGRSDRLGRKLRTSVDHAQNLTKHNQAITLCIAFDYGGRAEILRAIKQILSDGISGQEIEETLLNKYLYTHNIPDPDLIIRTGGEKRLSNFLLWQSAYSELYFTPVHWPDLQAKQIVEALDEFASRRRRFGSIEKALGS